MNMLNIGDHVFIQGEIVGIIKDRKTGEFKYTVEIPNDCYERPERIEIVDSNPALIASLSIER